MNLIYRRRSIRIYATFGFSFKELIIIFNAFVSIFIFTEILLLSWQNVPNCRRSISSIRYQTQLDRLLVSIIVSNILTVNQNRPLLAKSVPVISRIVWQCWLIELLQQSSLACIFSNQRWYIPANLKAISYCYKLSI